MAPATQTPANQTAPQAAHGIWSPSLVALDADLAPDEARTIAHMRWLLEGGCHGLAFMGTTSEATSFSVEERIALLDAALDAGIPAEKLMVGSGCAALSDSVRLTAHATAAGCAVLTLPPFYYKDLSDEAIYASYSEVIQRVGDTKLKLYFYHFPKLSCVPITHAAIERLLKAYAGVIKGLKDSSGDAAGCAAFIKAFPELAIFPGTESLLFEMLKLGGAGTITAGANVNPRLLRACYDSWRAGDVAGAEELQVRITAIRNALQGQPMVPGLKAVVARERGDEAWLRVRPPLLPLAPEAGAALADALNTAGFKYGAPA